MGKTMPNLHGAPRRRTVLSAAWLAGAAFVAAALLPLGALRASEAQLIEAAKKEGPMTWYVSFYGQNVADQAAAAFAKKYPGISVIPVRTTTGGAFQRLTQDLKSKVAVASVLTTTGIGAHYQILQRAGELAEYTPDNASKIIPTVRSAIVPGTVYPIGIGLMALAYNSAKVKEADAPKSWTDLLDPKWKGKLAFGHPSFSGFDAALAVTLMKEDGWVYYEKLAKNDPLIQRSTFDTITALNSGERVVGILPDGMTLDSGDKGNPLVPIYPSDGTVPILGLTAILKSAPQPATARLFTEFLLDVEHAQVVANTRYHSVRAEVPTILPGNRRLSDLKLTPIVPPEETEKELVGIVERWRDLFGR